MSLHEFQHSLAGLAQTPFVPRAQRMAWRMLVATIAESCAHSTAVRLVPWAMMPA